MHYYIDGYNILFRILKAVDEVRKQREDLTLELEKKISLLGLDVTLVFDSYYQEGESTKSHFKSLEIIFTAHHETADEFILHEIKTSKSPSEHIVVTSDKQLARLCKLCLAQTQSVEEFLDFIEKRYKNKLRQERLEAKPPPPSVPSQVNIKTAKTALSPQSEQTLTEGSFDFYLEKFNKEFQSLEQQLPPPNKNLKPPKIKKIKKIKENKEADGHHLSNYDRWLKAFETERDDTSNSI